MPRPSFALITLVAALSTAAAPPMRRASGVHLTDQSGRFCVDLPTGWLGNGNAIQLWGCSPDDNANQLWALAKNGHITSAKEPSKCLDAGENAVSGSSVHLWDCYEGLAQQTWIVENGAVRLQGANLCLDITDGKVQDGTRLQVWECDGEWNQKWTVASQ
ncbi:Endo-1,4-beta-xylanase A [Vanrija pseudolonga]|uniref:Endo-1,4-beta-xylanase A n=1 Tax=Vanrija pseudolonga TaxID=143232 RepID=A0AAF0Y1E7_9TREE|nr:Endo-1,4-beta-xylanase A [Vanrija pseudolonga]